MRTRPIRWFTDCIPLRGLSYQLWESVGRKREVANQALLKQPMAGWGGSVGREIGFEAPAPTYSHELWYHVSALLALVMVPRPGSPRAGWEVDTGISGSSWVG